MTRLFSLGIVLFFVSCNPEYKKCDFKIGDIYLKAYNDILNEIIVKRSYNLYLGADEERIFKMHSDNSADSIEIENETIRLHNKIFKDTSRFCVIYLDTFLRPTFNRWSYFQKNTDPYSVEIKNLLNTFSDKGEAIIDSLNSMQTKYSARDFVLCIACIKSLKEFKVDSTKCYIGKIAFSKLILNNTKDRGLLYYEFRCGSICGYGNLIVIKKVDDYWKIESSIGIWIS